MTGCELGIVEARFGRSWNWSERAHVIATLTPAYRFYLYAPKGDAALRRQWRRGHDDAELEALRGFAGHCRSLGVRFGVALSPVDLALPLCAADRADLARRVADLDALGIDDLAIFLDDIRGDVPNLARQQIAAVELCAGLTRADRLFFCPTYYSDDPVLDRAFGKRPAGYLEELGAGLDPRVRVFWTGEEVCSREYRRSALEAVGERLGRRVTLWDNYPVNDGVRMSAHLHLRAFTGRPAAIGDVIDGHAINPAIQPNLSCLPALTLVDSYAEGEGYAYGRSFRRCAERLFGDPLATMLADDLIALQDVGHDRLGDRRVALRARYAEVDHPAAREVVRWLDGLDLMTEDEVRTQ